jgi:hypothetical protein
VLAKNRNNDNDDNRQHKQLSTAFISISTPAAPPAAAAPWQSTKHEMPLNTNVQESSRSL